MALRDYFTKGTRKHLIKNIALAISIALFSISVLCLVMAPPNMMIDFPCFVSVDEAYLDGRALESENLPHAVLFITTHPRHTMGGGCIMHPLENHAFADIGGHRILVSGDTVTVDGNALMMGEDWMNKQRSYEFMVPWWIYEDQIMLKNEGFVSGYRLPDGTSVALDEEILIIIGSDSSTRKVNPLTLILSAVSAIIIVLSVIMPAIYHSKDKQRS